MSQDNTKCAKCGKPCGYDDGKGYWEGEDLAICGQCRTNLKNRFCAFFGLIGVSYNFYGVTSEWEDMDKILSRIKRDYDRRISYIVADKEFYERTQNVAFPMEA